MVRYGVWCNVHHVYYRGDTGNTGPLPGPSSFCALLVALFGKPAAAADFTFSFATFVLAR